MLSNFRLVPWYVCICDLHRYFFSPVHGLRERVCVCLFVCIGMPKCECEFKRVLLFCFDSRGGIIQLRMCLFVHVNVEIAVGVNTDTPFV